MFFPEGTRFTPEKHKISQAYEKQKNLKPLTYHLQPKTKGFTVSLPQMKGRIAAIYNLEFVFKNKDRAEPTMTSILLAKPLTVHGYLKRIPLEDVSDTEAEQEEFLRKLYYDKVKKKIIMNLTS